jgi:hypothetical protein
MPRICLRRTASRSPDERVQVDNDSDEEIEEQKNQ